MATHTTKKIIQIIFSNLLSIRHDRIQDLKSRIFYAKFPKKFISCCKVKCENNITENLEEI
jgi:hypothetical protein